MELEIINVFDIADSEQRSDFVALDIPQWLAVRNAAESWERAFSDDIKIIIAIRQRRNNNIVAQTNSAFTTYTTSDVRQALINDSVFVRERNIYEQIPDPLPINDFPQDTLTNLITMPTANAKALRLSIGIDLDFTSRLVLEGFDALITINVPENYNDLNQLCILFFWLVIF